MQHRVSGSLTSIFPYGASCQTIHPLGADEQLATLGLVVTDGAALAVPAAPTPPGGQIGLSEAYRICHEITRRNSKSFFFSTQLLPAEKRRAVRVLYAFCRASDDAVDHDSREAASRLSAWVHQVWRHEPPGDPVLIAWRDISSRFDLDPQLVKELLAGVAMDLTINRYATFADLWLYCYRVASVVGLLSMQIIGSAPGAEPYAIKLGVALQMTNILRDIAEDVDRGRVYLPQDELAAFGLDDSDIMARACDERIKSMMRFQVERAHRLYAESWAGIALLPEECRFAVGAAAMVYQGILDKIIAQDYDPFRGRVYLTLSEKLALLPKIWLRVRALKRDG